MSQFFVREIYGYNEIYCTLKSNWNKKFTEKKKLSLIHEIIIAKEHCIDITPPVLAFLSLIAESRSLPRLLSTREIALYFNQSPVMNGLPE